MQSSRPGPHWPQPATVAVVALRGRHLLALDVLAVFASYIAAFALRFDAPSTLFTNYLGSFWWPLPLLVTARLISFVGFGLYRRVWRYASVAELQSIVAAVISSSLVWVAVVFVLGAFAPDLSGFPRSVPIIEGLIALAVIGGIRFSLLIFGFGRHGHASGARALIVGAGGAGVTVARQLMADSTLGQLPIGFVDDHERIGHRLLGLPVLGTTEQLGAIVRQYGVGTVMFALPHVDGPTLRRLVRIAERENARSLTIPSMSEVVTGQVTSTLREIEVDDLLRRAPARTDVESILGSFRGRDILVTGAGGSIGSELSRQLLRNAPRRLLLLGRGENSIYELIEMLTSTTDESTRRDTELVPVIMDVKERGRIRDLVARYAPDAVFHVAAHKHVGFMERYPIEAAETNILGTQNVLEACEAAGVGRFVFVSSDKAVRPTSVMGATKRVGELLVREAAKRTGRPFVIVRFGNVLSSRGSVVLRFRRQLARGGPLTVTHQQVRRYFMTVSEAVQLILQATILGERGETFVLDMGEPVLISELARDLIELHGLVPGRDVQIVYTGLGTGEKLDEELFFPHERPRKTLHESIWVATDLSAAVSAPDLPALRAAMQAGDVEAVIAQLSRSVPDYSPARGWDTGLTTADLEASEGQ